MVYVAITLSGATAKDSLPMPNLPEPVPFQTLLSGPQTHGVSREHLAHAVIIAICSRFQTFSKECSTVSISTETRSGEGDGDLKGTRCL